jgi:hypothetical protein
MAESTLRRINLREPKDFDYSTQIHRASRHRRAVVTTLTTRIAPQLRLLRLISCANDNSNNSSRLETSRERVSNYSVTSSARSTTSWNQFRLVGFVDKLPTDQSYASLPTFYATHTLSINKLETPKPCLVWFEAVQPRTLSALEANLDHLLPL